MLLILIYNGLNINIKQLFYFIKLNLHLYAF